VVDLIPQHVCPPACNADGQVRDGAWVAELTGLLDLTGWPPGMRVIVRKERPHPGTQLRFTDRDGLGLTAFATNTTRGQLADLELRHRRRARCEDRIRAAKDTGLRNLPLHAFDANRIWIEIVCLATELTAWMQPLALHGHLRAAGNPNACDCAFSSVAAKLARHARRTRLRFATHWPYASLITLALARLHSS
jgi:Transposase DDE domain group 1